MKKKTSTTEPPLGAQTRSDLRRVTLQALAFASLAIPPVAVKRRSQSYDWTLFGPTMENAACNLIYVDRSIRQDRIVRASSYNSDGTEGPLAGSSDYETQALRENVQLLLEFIGDG